MQPQWTAGQGSGVLAIENPATGEVIAEVPDASRADVDRAASAAHEAFYDGRWSKLTPGERSLALWKLADLLEKNDLLQNRTPERKKSIRDKLKANRDRVEKSLASIKKEIQVLEEDIVRQGCPGITL